MNKDKVLEFANTIFSDISQVEGNPNLFRGLLNINSQKPAGIYFIDFNADIKVDNFDDYQDKVLSDEYYSHSDSLQWNLYLLFLQDSVDAKTKSIIERNDKYGRKYFFNESEFEDFFLLNKSNTEITSDVVLQWKQRLNEADLQEVHMKTKYTDAIDNFLNNRVPKAPAIETKKNTNAGKTFSFINTISLANNYREYPKQPRTFSFGKMNLVKGSNGVGKTSLFEAIELITCGKTARNSDIKENDNCISATVDSSKDIEVCQPSDNAKYRLRDAYWYGRTYPKDNFCYASFNRFNFFNTDAANDFANTNQESEVKAALSNIILGEEFNYLSDRIPKFAGYLKPYYNQLKQSLDDARQKIKRSSDVINRVNSSNSMGALKEGVNKNLATIRFSQQDFDLEKDLAKIEELSNNVKAITDKLLQNSFSRTYKDLKHYSELSQKNKKLFDDFQSQYRELNKKQGEKEQQKQALEGKKSLLIDCLKYYQDKRYFDIQFHENQLKKFEDKLKKIQFIKNNIKNKFSGLNEEERLLELITAENKELQSLNAKATENETILKETLSHLGELDKIVKEIKSLGARFLEHSVSPTICPLCETKFSENQLLERIKHIAKEAPQSDRRVEDLYSKRLEYQNAINRCKAVLDYLQSIEKIASSVLSNGASQNSLNKVVSEINLQLVKVNAKDSVRNCVNSLIRLRSIVYQFKSLIFCRQSCQMSLVIC